MLDCLCVCELHIRYFGSYIELFIYHECVYGPIRDGAIRKIVSATKVYQYSWDSLDPLTLTMFLFFHSLLFIYLFFFSSYFQAITNFVPMWTNCWEWTFHLFFLSLSLKTNAKIIINRLTITASCPMNLEYFPMDRQLCQIEIESCEYLNLQILYCFCLDKNKRRTKWNTAFSRRSFMCFFVLLPMNLFVMSCTDAYSFSAQINSLAVVQIVFYCHSFIHKILCV